MMGWALGKSGIRAGALILRHPFALVFRGFPERLAEAKLVLAQRRCTMR